MKWLFSAVLVVAGCGPAPPAPEVPDLISPAELPDASASPQDLAVPPTYTSLYQSYFGPGTPGHCGNSNCHLGTPVVHVWICGATRDDCFAGMVKVGIVSTTDPTHSSIADPANSALNWINPNGPMPRDNLGPNDAARAAIEAWVAAGAKND